MGRLIRKAFVPGEGYSFTDSDYSQIELRILASMSGDEELIKAYRENRDIHRITASKVFHVPFDEVTPLQRRNAKAVNFGIVYGISAFGLAENIDAVRHRNISIRILKHIPASGPIWTAVSGKRRNGGILLRCFTAADRFRN